MLTALVRLALVCAVLPLPQVAPAISTAMSGTVSEYEVARGETLTDIAARFGIDVATLARQNERPATAPLRAGTRLLIDARHIVPVTDAPIVVNVPQRHVFLRRADGQVLAFAAAVGRPTWRTPRGSFTVVQKTVDPTWHVPPSIQDEMRRTGKPVLKAVPPSPANPLGRYWMALSIGGIGMHGTNAPRSIYTATTHGCIRIHPDRVQVLFDSVDVGTGGEIVYEPVLMAEVDERIFVEVHRDIYRLGPAAGPHLRALAARGSVDTLIDWTLVETAIRQASGIAVDVTRRP
jgi:L,D-transpeptidase ErfK/SrfK